MKLTRGAMAGILLLVLAWAGVSQASDPNVAWVYTGVGMTGIDFTDYVPNVYGRTDMSLDLVSEHGMEMTCTYTAYNTGLLWNEKLAGDFGGNEGPSLILVRTDLQMFPDPLEFSFWATDGSGEKAVVSSFAVVWYYTRYWDVELYDAMDNMIGERMTFNGLYYDFTTIGWETRVDNVPTSMIHKVKIYYNDLGGGTSWGGIFGGTLASSDLYYAGHEVAQPNNCTDVQNWGYGLPMDFNEDCIVNLLDFSVFAAGWMQCNDPQQFAVPGTTCVPNW